MDQKQVALEAIQKKLVGKELSYKEIYAIMDQIADARLGDVLTTYFVASGYSKGFSNEEIYFLTRAMVETGERLHFRGVVADKHSIGGTPGTRTTLVVVPIIAAAGFKIPKSSSRAITTPAGTADAMEVMAKVVFSKEEIYTIVEKTNACIVWGGSFKIAPADDEIIKIEEPLLFESFDKILVSVMAKKVAFGATHVVIDLPYGITVKVHRAFDADILKGKFEYLAKKFDIKIEVIARHVEEPAGNGIGPLLEARDALKVLEQSSDRPVNLEKKALLLASCLLKLCLQDAPDYILESYKKFNDVTRWAQHLLESGKAHEKMMQIIEAQGGNPKITSSLLVPAKHKKTIVSSSSGKMKHINNKDITLLAKILGAPLAHGAGLFLHKKLGDTLEKGEELVTFYSESPHNLSEAVDSLPLFPIFKIQKQ